MSVPEEAIAEVVTSEKKSSVDLLALIYGPASLAFEKMDDQEWLVRRFTVFYEILKDTPVYQEMARRNREEGIEQGKEKGRVEEARKAVLLAVEHKFPSLSPLATRLTDLLDDVNVINDLLVKVITIQDRQEAELLLLQEIRQREQS